jgi:hypothetical protein
MINDHIKGWFFLIKELTAIFASRRQGTLVFVYPDTHNNTGKDDTADILGPSALAAFRAVVNGLLAAAHSEPYTTIGFSTTETGNEAAFASFIFKNIEKHITGTGNLTGSLTGIKHSNGKLYKFGKLNFFK